MAKEERNKQHTVKLVFIALSLSSSWESPVLAGSLTQTTANPILPFGGEKYELSLLSVGRLSVVLTPVDIKK